MKILHNVSPVIDYHIKRIPYISFLADDLVLSYNNKKITTRIKALYFPINGKFNANRKVQQDTARIFFKFPLILFYHCWKHSLHKLHHKATDRILRLSPFRIECGICVHLLSPQGNCGYATELLCGSSFPVATLRR